jgi:antitoxin VapB
MLTNVAMQEASVNQINTQKTWPAHVVQQDGRRLVEIPQDIAMPATEYVLRQDGDALILEPRPQTLREFLDGLEPIDEDWPDVDEGLLPAKDINL